MYQEIILAHTSNGSHLPNWSLCQHSEPQIRLPPPSCSIHINITLTAPPFLTIIYWPIPLAEASYHTRGQAIFLKTTLILCPCTPSIIPTTPPLSSPYPLHISGRNLLTHQRPGQHPEKQRPGQLPEKLVKVAYPTRSQASILSPKGCPDRSESTHIIRTPAPNLCSNCLLNQRLFRPSEVQLCGYTLLNHRTFWLEDKRENTHPTKPIPETGT